MIDGAAKMAATFPPLWAWLLYGLGLMAIGATAKWLYEVKQ